MNESKTWINHIECVVLMGTIISAGNKCNGEQCKR